MNAAQIVQKRFLKGSSKIYEIDIASIGLRMLIDGL